MGNGAGGAAADFRVAGVLHAQCIADEADWEIEDGRREIAALLSPGHRYLAAFNRNRGQHEGAAGELEPPAAVREEDVPENARLLVISLPKRRAGEKWGRAFESDPAVDGALCLFDSECV